MRRKTLMRIYILHTYTRVYLCVPTQCNSVGGITERGGERARRRRKKSNKIIIKK
jgi:hypothetical protein